jgi:hypothetical protein
MCGGEQFVWKELQQKIAEKNANGNHVRIEWSSDGEHGKGKLMDIKISGDSVEFFIVDDRQEVGSFTMRSARNVLGMSPQEGDDLYIFSHYMGGIKILHDI